MLRSVQPISKQLPERVAEQIKELIREKSLQIGEKLPNEFELAAQLEVGRGTVREAVKILVSQNVLEIRRGKGTYVSERRGLADDPLGLWTVTDERRLALDLCEVRMMLEPQIAQLAAVRADEEGTAQLELAVKQVEEALMKGEDHTEADIRFHETLARLCRNVVIPKLVPVIQSSVSVFIHVTDAKLKEETLRAHRRILKAVREHDGDAAREAMMQHLQSNRDWIEKEEQNIREEKK